MTDWRPIKSIPDTNDFILVTGPHGYMEVRRAKQLRALFIERDALGFEEFYWAPIDPPPSESKE